MAAFSKDIKDLGFLTPDCVLFEIDWACRVRRCSQGRLLNDPAAPDVGSLLKGLLKMLYTVETVLHTAFATQPIVSVAGLESAILKMPAFKQVASFKDADIGELQRHPEVLRRLRLDDPAMPSLPIPKTFPKLSHDDIIKGLVESLPKKFWDWNDQNGWNLEKGLTFVAEQNGFLDSRLLGVFVQQEFLFRTILCIYKQRELKFGGRDITNSVRKALQQVESVQCDSQTPLHCCDWKLWEKMLANFSKLKYCSERFEFVQELTIKSFTERFESASMLG